MSFDSDRVECVTFDSYSTLVDVESTVGALEEVVDDPAAVAREWRARSLQYTMVANHLGEYRPFYDLNRLALEYALARRGADTSREEREEILAVYHDLEVFPDVRDGVARLREAGYETLVLSNGNPEMLATMVDGADLGDLLTDTVSADEIETYKPSPALYEHAAKRAGVPVSRVTHVSAAQFDVQGARAAGMQGVWLDRKSLPADPFGAGPDLTIESIHDLCDALGAGRSG